MGWSRRAVLLGGAGVLGVASVGGSLVLPSPAPGARLLGEAELTTVRALLVALFPEVPGLSVSGAVEWAARRVDELLVDLLEPAQATAVRYTLRVIELGPVPSRGGRFSSLEPEVQREVLDTWADPAWLPRRLALDGLRTLLGMAYFENPDVLEALGWELGCGGPR